MLTVRLEPLPPYVKLLLSTRAGLEELAEKAREPAGVSTSPMVKLIGPVEVSSLMTRLPVVEMLGKVFTKFTVTVKVWVKVSSPPLATPPLSCTVTVMSAEPLLLGVKLKVPVGLGLV